QPRLRRAAVLLRARAHHGDRGAPARHRSGRAAPAQFHPQGGVSPPRAGRPFGIGLAAGVEPSGSNMAYVSLAQTAEERGKTDPKSGANASAVVSIDPSGSVTVRLSSTPNGQGHATVAAQIVADKLGLKPDDIDVVTEIDTLTSNWSIASGNYSNRFAAIVVDAIAQTADKVAHAIRLIGADALEAPPDKI